MVARYCPKVTVNKKWEKIALLEKHSCWQRWHFLKQRQFSMVKLRKKVKKFVCLFLVFFLWMIDTFRTVFTHNCLGLNFIQEPWRTLRYIISITQYNGRYPTMFYPFLFPFRNNRKKNLPFSTIFTQGKFPFAVSFGFRAENSSSFQHFCGGSIVENDFKFSWAISAAHCFINL